MFLFIVNRAAGSGKGLVYWRKIQRELDLKGISYEAILSDADISTRQFIAKNRSSQAIHAVGVIGGDGTVHSVLQEIAGTKIPLAIFPAGSGNDTARTFQLTDNPVQFANQVSRAETEQVDLIEVNKQVGITVAGMGIDTVIGEKVNRASYKPFFNKIGIGSLAYIIGALQAAFAFQPFKTTLKINGQTKTFEKTWLLASGNTASYGGGLAICPNADPTDGSMNITIFHSLPRVKAFLRIFPALLTGKTINKSGVSYLQGTDLKIITDRPTSAILDGELIATTPLHIKIHPKALSLVLTR